MINDYDTDFGALMQQVVTLRDVCAAAGVSTYTGSRALNGHPGVAEETRQRVLRVAAELGYVANQHAKDLKNPNNKTVAVLTANMANQYYAVLVSGIETILDAEGYNCITMDSVLAGTYSQAREDSFVSSIMAQRVAAVVITYILSASNMQTLSNWGVPLIFVDFLRAGKLPQLFLGDDGQLSRKLGSRASPGRPRLHAVGLRRPHQDMEHPGAAAEGLRGGGEGVQRHRRHHRRGQRQRDGARRCLRLPALERRAPAEPRCSMLQIRCCCMARSRPCGACSSPCRETPLSSPSTISNGRRWSTLR